MCLERRSFQNIYQNTDELGSSGTGFHRNIDLRDDPLEEVVVDRFRKSIPYGTSLCGILGNVVN